MHHTLFPPGALWGQDRRRIRIGHVPSSTVNKTVVHGTKPTVFNPKNKRKIARITVIHNPPPHTSLPFGHLQAVFSTRLGAAPRNPQETTCTAKVTAMLIDFESVWQTCAVYKYISYQKLYQVSKPLPITWQKETQLFHTLSVILKRQRN